ncbi:macrophage erythroblast attacher [Favolaschia claudopus]|uniref:Macrophage erythroblast attacher n=1 Tax=Favolaschia claudopus TaxID=2862362 RepID=A0AAW0D5V1_9AGAR
MSSPGSSPSSFSPVNSARPSFMHPSSPLSSPESEILVGHFGRRISADAAFYVSPVDDEKQQAESAARRASHNLVERQRRDKLNARILDLAAMLPNLAGVRRPSRLAITRSSIAYIQSARRHRIVAAQQLHSLHTEAEALRREVNEWRRRAGVPSVLEPRRTEAFMIVASGSEVELLDDMVEPYDEEDAEEAYAQSFSPAIYRRPSYPPLPRHTALPSPFAYSVSSPSSSSDYLSPYTTPPSSAEFYAPAAPPTLHHMSKLDLEHEYVSPVDPVIVSPTPAHPYDAQNSFILKTEEEAASWAMYGGTPPPAYPEDGPHW